MMPASKHILIAGGGPAGALCGERLARAGFRVTIFEERRGWEKPCGGGVTWKTLERYPFLLDGGLEKKLVRSAELIAPSGRRVTLPLSRPLAVYSRAVLNAFLLGRAEAVGCAVVPEHVRGARANGGVRLRTTEREVAGDFLVIATGARNALAVEDAPAANCNAAGWKPGPRDLELTFGYFLAGEDDRLRVQFLENFEGYLWSFPRAGHLAVGICGKLAPTRPDTGKSGSAQNTSAALQEKLHRFLAAENIPHAGSTVYSHLLPSLERRSWKRLPLTGPAWARIGDAAGLVDPITGEGIYYALRSGELLAEALVAGDSASYARRVEKDFGAELRCAAAWQPTFYRGRWPRLGRGWRGRCTTERMVEAVQRSSRFAGLVDELFAGSQRYRGLKWRLLRMLLPANGGR